MAAVNFVMPFRPAFDSNAYPIAGAQAVFTLAGTTTLTPIYTNSGLSIEATNPLIANASGQFPQTFLDDTIPVRLRIFDKGVDITTAASLEDYDPYDPVELGAKGDPGGDASQIGTYAQTTAMTVAATIKMVVTTGYTTQGDGGNANYKRVDAEPSHTLKFRTLDRLLSDGATDASNGGWWEIDEDRIYVEQAGGGTGVADNGTVINNIIASFADRTDTGTGSSELTTWGAREISFRYPGRYTHSTRIVRPYLKNFYFVTDVPGKVVLKYTGSDDVGIRVEPSGFNSDFGFINVSYEGGDIAIVGANNSKIRFQGMRYSHAKRNGLWLVDSPIYYDSDYPSFAVTAITAASPVRATVTGHGLSGGEQIGLTDCIGEERVNGTWYAKVIDANTIDIYSNSGLTTPLDGTGFDAGSFSSGLMTEGYTGASRNNGVNTVWMNFEDVEFDTSVGHQLVVESATYLLFTCKRMRFRRSGKTPFVLDCAGANINESEFIGVDSTNGTTEVFLHIRARHNDCTALDFDKGRFGPESTANPKVSGDYTTANYYPPTRYVCIGPLDGTPANKAVADVNFDNFRWYGENSSYPNTLVMIDVNAKVDRLKINGGQIRNLPSGSNFIKETATAAGRTAGDNNTIGFDVSRETTATSSNWYSGTGVGWNNRADGVMTVKGNGKPTVGTLGAAMGSGGTVTVGNVDNENLFTLTITTGTGTSGTSICPITLPTTRKRNVKPLITPVNAAARALGNWGYGSPSTSGFTIFAPSTPAISTAYTVDIEIRSTN